MGLIARNTADNTLTVDQSRVAFVAAVDIGLHDCQSGVASWSLPVL